jgi:hypothetical protein
MKKLPIWALFVIAFILACGVIIAGFMTTLHFTNQSAASKASIAEQADTRTDYAKISDFSVSSTDAAATNALQEAFTQKKLAALWSTEIPNQGGTLVLAAPTPDGTIKMASCATARSFCAFFVSDRNGDRLLTRGDRITGFTGLERFIDKDHAMIATAFSLMNYSMVGRYALDLNNGQLIPRLILEVDADDVSSVLTASGYGGVVVLSIQGERDNGRTIPNQISLQTDDGTILSTFDQKTIASFVDLEKDTTDPIKPLVVVPSEKDVDSLQISVLLYGKLYVFDLKRKAIAPAHTGQAASAATENSQIGSVPISP